MQIYKKERNERVLKLRAAGLTYEEISKTLNISRQRAHQIVKKELSTPMLDKELA